MILVFNSHKFHGIIFGMIKIIIIVIVLHARATTTFLPEKGPDTPTENSDVQKQKFG